MEILSKTQTFANGEPVRYKLQTVKDLIERLKKLDQDAVVVSYGGDDYCYYDEYDNGVAFPVYHKLQGRYKDDSVFILRYPIVFYNKDGSIGQFEYLERFSMKELAEQGVNLERVVIL